MRKFFQTGSCILCMLFVLSCTPVRAQIITSAEIDTLVEKTLKAFQVPGIAVGIVQDGKLIHAKGYGVRSLSSPGKVDANTVFGIASNSKAFTAAALAMLIDEKKITWDTKVTDIIPEFKLANPYVTDEFTIRDLLTHRSGLGLGAGDLMMFPSGGDFTVKDVIHNLRYLKPVSSFRTKFDYDNLLYIVAGEVISRVSGASWEDFIEKRILQPLKMDNSAGNFFRLKDSSNAIDAHAPVDGVVKRVERDFSVIADAAGGIYSSVNDMSKWLIMQMDSGKYGNNHTKRLFSADMQNEMWAVQTVLPANGPSSYNTHFAGYGLGWFLSDVKGYKQISHTGGLLGMVTQVTIIPELRLGIMVFTNQQSGAAFSAITNTIKDSYLGMPKKDRVQQYRTGELGQQQEAKKVTDQIWADISAEQKKQSGTQNTDIYLGTYSDKWFGEITISKKNGKLWFDAKRSPKLTGELLSYKGNTFIAKWSDRSLDADAYVQFSLDVTGQATGIKMNAISPLTDFSFDFQDLELVRVSTQ